VLDAWPVEQVIDSDELYLLSARGVDVVKVRDGLMDVKHRHQVSDEGLELWSPVMKGGFPLTQSEVDTVAAALCVDPAATVPEPVTLADLLREVIEPNAELRAVEVHKRRVRYRIDGCAAELTTVRTPRATTRTIAVESEGPAAVVSVLRQLGLALRPNVDFARGLRLLDGFGAERFAVVDVGTNSVKLHIGDRDPDGGWTTVVDRAVVTRLGEGLEQGGALAPEAMARTVEAVADMAEGARRHRAAAIAAVGTAGLRIATNAADLVRAVETRCGVSIDVISGEAEARLAYRAATAGLSSHGSRVVFDTGGGSSQFTFGHGDQVDERFSVDVGAARFTEQFGLDDVVPRERLEAALDAIATGLARLDGRPTPEALLGMGGAVTNLTAIKHRLATYDSEIVQGAVLDRTEIDRQIELFRTRTADERRSIVGLQPARAPVILAGACIVRTVLDKLGKDSLLVSDRGLRHGVLVERFAVAPPDPDAPRTVEQDGHRRAREEQR
jgi:exopolyphosphatase/guanosine-5'-triphosphate,3'-diphosphate pyrophosphatase